jgi:hypothetical protein
MRFRIARLGKRVDSNFSKRIWAYSSSCSLVCMASSTRFITPSPAATTNFENRSGNLTAPGPSPTTSLRGARSETGVVTPQLLAIGLFESAYLVQFRCILELVLR